MRPTQRTFSVGVDVDSLWLYYRIHGLDEEAATNAAWRVGVPRFVALFAAYGVLATFYCVAEDLELAGNEARVRALAEAGHEIGNHTHRHPYSLTRLPAVARRAEVAEGRRRLEAASQAPVMGFRAPGYNTDAALLADVAATGHIYDSSVFPCAPYYLAKATVMGLMRLRGRSSHSVMGTPRVLLAPRSPYRVDPAEPHRRGDGLAQFPISVALGAPLIGTAFTALGVRGSRVLARVACGLSRHLTVEFHAIDLMSLVDDHLDAALTVQPDLRRSVAEKRATFSAVIEALQRSHTSVRLCDLAAERMT